MVNGVRNVKARQRYLKIKMICQYIIPYTTSYHFKFMIPNLHSTGLCLQNQRRISDTFTTNLWTMKSLPQFSHKLVLQMYNFRFEMKIYYQRDGFKK